MRKRVSGQVTYHMTVNLLCPSGHTVGVQFDPFMSSVLENRADQIPQNVASNHGLNFLLSSMHCMTWSFFTFRDPLMH